MNIRKVIFDSFVLTALFLATGSSYADIRINEFMASNDSTLVDDDGDASDWIELFNDGLTTINLTGWFLTDDSAEPDKWALPAIDIAANTYLVVYASGKDRIGSANHTNFKLGKSGEYLGLIRADGVSIEDDYAPEYPQQSDDISYGLSLSGSIGFLQTPTPGAANSDLILPSVVIEPESQTFTGTLSITLNTETPLDSGDSVRYTLDGSDPSSTSSEYTGPLTLGSSADMRTAVFRGTESSPVRSAQYIEYANDLIGFTSTLPLVVLDSRGEELGSDDIYTASSAAVIDVMGGVSSLNDNLDHLGYAGLRIRGSSSSSFEKKSYRLELWDVDQDDLDIDILSMGAESDWLLIAPGFMDRNLISNSFMSNLANDIGIKGMEWRFVEVFLNSDGTAIALDDYQGIYLLFENIKVSDQRIDIAKISPSDTTEPDITGGYILKRDRSDPDEFFFIPDGSFDAMGDTTNRTVVNRPKLADLPTAQRNYIRGYIDDFESAILGSTPMSTTSGYRKYIEEKSWIDAHILAVLSKDADLLRLSNYFYKDRNARLVNGPVWDFDRSLNSADLRDDNPDQLFPTGEVNPFGYSWWGKLFAIEHFDEKYRRRWHELRQGPLATDSLFARIDTMAAPLFEPYPREHDRWGGVEGYGSRYGGSSNYQGEIDALKDWLDLRLTFLDNYLIDPGDAQCVSSTLDYPLVANTWAMLSLPCQPPIGQTITSIFGDDITGTYGQDWIAFTFDPSIDGTGKYIPLPGNQLPQMGQGFWILQTIDELAVLDLPVGSTPAPVSTAPGCTTGSACAAVPLSTKSRWMLLGNPLRSAVPKKLLRIVDSTGPCAQPLGCTIATARAADILPSDFFTYNREASSTYQPVAEEGLVNAWSAFWAFAGAASGGPDQRLLVPTRLNSQ